MTISRAKSAKTSRSHIRRRRRKASGPSYSITELIRQIRPNNLHEPVDFGPPVGKEIWIWE